MRDEYTYAEACKKCKRGHVIVSVKPSHNWYRVKKGKAVDKYGLCPYEDEKEDKWTIMDKGDV